MILQLKSSLDAPWIREKVSFAPVGLVISIRSEEELHAFFNFFDFGIVLRRG
jgi:hypothetical protein